MVAILHPLRGGQAIGKWWSDSPCLVSIAGSWQHNFVLLISCHSIWREERNHCVVMSVAHLFWLAAVDYRIRTRVLAPSAVPPANCQLTQSKRTQTGLHLHNVIFGEYVLSPIYTN